MTAITINSSATNEQLITFNNQSFQRAGKDYFILSGEMHYFRIQVDHWEKHLEQMKKAGLNTVSSYIPWSLHEQIEGQPDFTGKYEDNLNLEGFINLCHEMDMNLILKPGPYILAELKMHGIPKWYFEKYPDSMAVDANGDPYPNRYTCYAHPDFKAKTLQWYDAIMSLISSNEISKGGPVIMMQVCNEIGLFQWLDGAGDYSAQNISDYQTYLKEHYQNLNKINTQYASHFASWDQIRPPRGKVNSRADYFNYRDWETFHRHAYAKYISWLIGEIRYRDVTVPLFHNVPGWVFGRAKDMPVCLSMYHELIKEYPDIILGVDHIPENPNYRNFHDDRLINEYTKAMQGGNGPLYVAELQAGTREANVQVYPGEMELFYKACLANGVVAMNYYMFSQGKNPPGWSVYDPTFYLQTPLDVEGNPGECFHVMQRIGILIETHGDRICGSTTNAGQALGIYPNYYYREFLKPLFTGENFDDPAQAACTLDKTFVTDNLLFDSLGKLLVMDNQEFDAVDLTSTSIEDLFNYRQLWIACTEMMDAEGQTLLLDYVKQGGHLISFPTVPQMNLDGHSCTILRDGLKIQTTAILDDSSAMIQWADSSDEVHAFNRIETFSAENSQPIATACNGKTCGIKITHGEGSATILGTGFNFQAENHKQAWQKLGLPEFQKPTPHFSNPQITTRIRYHKQTGGYLFLLNYHNQDLSGIAFIPGAESLSQQEIHLPATSGLILPFNLPLGENRELLETTSEVSSISIAENEITLEVAGHHKTQGLMICKLDKGNWIAEVNGNAILSTVADGEIEIEYAHETDTTQIIFKKKD